MLRITNCAHFFAVLRVDPRLGVVLFALEYIGTLLHFCERTTVPVLLKSVRYVAVEVCSELISCFVLER